MNPRLLFVDDEAEVLEGLSDSLHRHRHRWEMVFVTSPAQAIGQLRAGAFNVVVSDMRMPGIDGAAVLGAAQELQPHAVRIILSGHSDMQAALRAVPVAHVCLAKPCDRIALQDVLERACELSQALGNPEIHRVATAAGTLPAAPAVYRELTQALADDDATAHDVARIFSSDPALCAKILQVVNSAFFGLGRSISSPDEAVTYLGLDTIRMLTLSLAGHSSMPGASRTLIDTLQRHSLQTASLARRIAHGSACADNAFLAGMLHDIGKLVISASDPEYVPQLLRAAGCDGGVLVELEHDRYGCTHAEVGSYLLSLWGLPFDVVEAVALHHHGPRLHEETSTLEALRIANLLLCERTPRATSAVGDPGEIERMDRWRPLLDLLDPKLDTREESHG
jgi:putative nucleotidyltransferase with HDIG domain